MKYSVCCDFDGTISIGDIGNRFFRTFTSIDLDGILNEWKAGRIDSRECLTRECEYVTVTKEEFTEFTDKQKIDPTFHTFYDFCKEKNWRLLILSDGLDFYVKRILKSNNLNTLPVFANQIKFIGRDKIAPEFPYYEKGCLKCGNCKGYFIKEEKKKGNKVIFIGNGYSDRCAVPAADIVFAKDDFLKYCEQNNYPCYTYKNFNDIITQLNSIITG